MEFMDLTNSGELLHFVKKVATEASVYAKQKLLNKREVESDQHRDVKVVADRELESIIVDYLQGETDYQILTEEKGFIEGANKTGEYRWIIDPLDGSLNYSRSIPIFCISIALWKNDTPLLGVIYDFIHDEMFSGIVGKGAWLNSHEIHVSDVKQKQDAVLCTGFPVKSDFSEKPLLDFVKDIQAFKKIRLIGSAALSLAYVSSGRADYYQEDEIAVWDVAAGIALVMSAGGAVDFKRGKVENRLIVRASNKNLLEPSK